VGRAVLAGILAVQTLLTLRLQNTAFDDEALYLYAGHLQLDAIAKGGPLRPEFTDYFSGSPLLYPPAAAALDSAFGLSGARALSLAFMLGATILVYALSRLLFDEMAGSAPRRCSARRSRPCSSDTSPPTTPPLCSCWPWPPGWRSGAADVPAPMSGSG
jgi:hypothetical protein